MKGCVWYKAAEKSEGLREGVRSEKEGKMCIVHTCSGD